MGTIYKNGVSYSGSEAYDDTALAARVTTLETDKTTVTTASIPGGGGGEEVTVSVQEAGDQTGEKVLGVRYFTDDQGAVSGDPTLIVGNENFSLQRELVSGTNIKTLNNMSLLGSGNISIEKGAGIPLDANNLPSANAIMQMVNDEALVYIDKWMIERVNRDEENTFWIHTRWGDYTRTYKFLGVENLDAPLVLEEAAIDNAPTAVHIDTSAVTQYSSAQLRAPGGAQAVRIVVHDDYARLEVAKGNTTKTKLLYGGNYIVDKPEGSNAQLGNVVQVGTLQDISGEVGIFEFFYRTSALPNATSKEYTLLPLLQDYDIVDFLDGTGVTSNGIFIGNGRTDGTNYVIIQQFSKNRKGVILRTYQDYSAQTALLKIKFLGTKTSTT